ncbi:universal stress protein [Streptomyces ureilyticus]|uniref:Universal stress protein n=1 Tax=Streptomyces ureilyticus TaxID=1775131 RepID=A0ABX0E503_9ACTN|nr:universal stress protein [Streptomyces ureilyticus]NGO47648.1 universal stress protein [Streptomyces ureilyticus]
MTRPITVGVDGSPESLAAVAWAGREAARRELPLRLVLSWESDDAGEHDAKARDALREAASGLAERHPQLPVSSDLLDAAPVPSLVAEAADAEMLVLGSRGHGAIVGFLLGSVGQQVTAESGRPVVLVRADDRAEHEAAGREIVVGQQGGPDGSAAALGFAFETAAARGAGVRVVRAWSLPAFYEFNPSLMKTLDEAGGLEPYEKQALNEALKPWRERFPDVPVTEHVEIGSAGEVLLSVASPAQLMVVGRRAQRSAVGSRIGSVAHSVLHHAPCPVAVVPPS